MQAEVRDSACRLCVMIKSGEKKVIISKFLLALFAAIFFTGILFLSPVEADSVTDFNSTYELTIIGQSMTLKARDAPFAAILEEIASQSGIRIESYISINDVVSANMVSIPMKLGLAKMVRNYSHSFVYARHPEDHQEYVSRLFIYAKTGAKTGVITYIQDNAKKNQVPQGQLSETGFLVNKAGILLYPDTPQDQDPLLSMKAIDPLMRFEIANEHNKMTGGRPLLNMHERNILRPHASSFDGQTFSPVMNPL